MKSGGGSEGLNKGVVGVDAIASQEGGRPPSSTFTSVPGNKLAGKVSRCSTKVM